MNVSDMDRCGPGVTTPPGTSWVREDQAMILQAERDTLRAQLDAARLAERQAYYTLISVGYNPDALTELRKAFGVEVGE